MSSNEKAEISRDKVIIRTSIIGILTNVLLAGFKAGVGLISNSIAVTLDAVNNLSDALSSIGSFIGIGLSATIPSLGRMISQAQSAFRTFPWEFWPPVLVASMVTIILYLLGQNLADATDPRTHM